jgi:hypothetical protein
LADGSEIEVTDPTHPLYGRRFPVHSISHPVHGLGHVFVMYRQDVQLRIPLASTNLVACPRVTRPTKFTLVAIRQVLSLVKEWETPCLTDPQPSGNESPPA